LLQLRSLRRLQLDRHTAVRHELDHSKRRKACNVIYGTLH
jgi:hypothetical protein